MRHAQAALLVLVLLAPLPAAQAAAPYTVDATLELVDGTKALERHVFGYEGGRVQWTLLVPKGATFVRAYDAGSALSATVQGDELRVETRRSPFTIEYHRAAVEDAPFTKVSTSVASAPDSPTSIRVALPAGWSLVGQRASDGAVVDAQGALRATGPQAAEFLLLPPGMEDAGPDARVHGDAALREAVVDVTATAANMTLTIVYDTDVYSRDWTIGLPDGAALRSVSTPWGAVDAQVVAGDAKFSLPYPAGFGLGARPFTMVMDLASPESHGGAFRKVQASVPAAAEDEVRVEFRVADGLVATGVHASKDAMVDGLGAAGQGPVAATLSFLPPAAAGTVRFTEHPFVVHAPADLEAAARATAAKAAQLLPDVAGFAGGANVTRPFYVAYTDAPVFDWEAGFYAPGLNTISIRAQDLRNVTDGQAHLKPVQVLVHETTHGLLDRLVDRGPGDLSFFQEGLARLAETQVELRMEDEVLDCRTTLTRQSCVRHSARPEAERIQGFHASGGRFDPLWAASTTPPEERAFLYDYSGLVLHRYVRASPDGALEAALADLASAPGPDEPGLAAVRFVDALLLQSPALSRDALLHPGREAAPLALEEFRHCMGPLLAPAYPFDPAPREPRGGCPSPAPPTQAERDGLTRAPTQPIESPPPAKPAPVRTTPRVIPVSPGADPAPPVEGDLGETPGGVVNAPAPIPMGGAILATVALLLVAAMRRRG